MVNYNLKPGQWQIGEVIFGRHTLIPINAVDIQPGDVAAQDMPVPMADEIMFGQDYSQPGTMTFTMAVYKNKAIRNTAIAGSPAMNFSNDVDIEDLAYEWDAVEIRTRWGEPMALRKCDNYGITRRIYGRTSKFGASELTLKSEFRTVQAEFRRIDNKVYSDEEYFIAFDDNSVQNISRFDGRASTWVRFLLYGEMEHPTINFGTQQIELDYEIETGEVVEISSYPWLRRCVNSEGLNLSAKLVADSPYLDQITFPNKGPKSVSWTAENASEDARMVFLWRDAFSVTS